MAWRQNDTDCALSSSLQTEEKWGTSCSAHGKGAFELGLEFNKDTSGTAALPAALCAGDWHDGREVLREGGFVCIYGISLVMRVIEQ